MSDSVHEPGIRSILLDIEGTTTPIAFVHEVLFSYARSHLAGFVTEHFDTPDLAEIGRRLAAEHAADTAAGEQPPSFSTDTDSAAQQSITEYSGWLMDRDRKSPGLKLLQGLIWERGYQRGELRGRVFPDVPPAIRRWRDAGLVVAIYSSGSVLAQRRLFESTEHGDLTPLISGFFDTAVGPKLSSSSYTRIAQELACQPATMLFLSDVSAELRAARAAGLQTLLVVRPGNAPQAKGEFEEIRGFGESPVPRG